ncbi:MAG: ABC transporter ATP-binding protein [Clostridia bacterium]|nr:ABC transporter ATP-binding protein [Clostridia bacterium]
MNAIEVENLNIDFGNFKIENLNLTVRKGAITGLIGANGAGKTTLIKAIMRAQNAQSGKILYCGKSFAGNETEIFSSVACVFDGVKFAITVKPKRLVKLYKSIYQSFDEQKFLSLAQKFSLPLDLRVSKYSFGMQKKLSFILALCQGADTLILDEPTSGVDPFDRNELTSLIQEFMMDENHAVLFSTHVTEDLDKIADYIVMMDNGKIVLDKDKESLTESYRLVRAAELTPELEACAIGVVKDMFGYTFITQNTELSGEGLQTKVPTVEELFVHLVSQRKSGGDGNSSQSIFGI